MTLEINIGPNFKGIDPEVEHRRICRALQEAAHSIMHMGGDANAKGEQEHLGLAIANLENARRSLNAAMKTMYPRKTDAPWR